jgi:hypothetical protein
MKGDNIATHLANLLHMMSQPHLYAVPSELLLCILGQTSIKGSQNSWRNIIQIDARHTCKCVAVMSSDITRDEVVELSGKFNARWPAA